MNGRMVVEVFGRGTARYVCNILSQIYNIQYLHILCFPLLTPAMPDGDMRG